jgi:hypothetical protein
MIAIFMIANFDVLTSIERNPPYKDIEHRHRIAHVKGVRR